LKIPAGAGIFVGRAQMGEGSGVVSNSVLCASLCQLGALDQPVDGASVVCFRRHDLGVDAEGHLGVGCGPSGP